MIRVDFEKLFSKENQDQLFEMWKKDNKNQDLLILSDYNKGSINPKDWIEASLKKNIPIIVDPKGSSFEKYSGVCWVSSLACQRWTGRLGKNPTRTEFRSRSQ